MGFVAQLENAYVSEDGLKNMFKELDIDGDERVSKTEIQEYAKRKESLAVNQNMHMLQEDKRNMEYVENVFNVIGINSFMDQGSFTKHISYTRSAVKFYQLSFSLLI